MKHAISITVLIISVISFFIVLAYKYFLKGRKTKSNNELYYKLNNLVHNQNKGDDINECIRILSYSDNEYPELCFIGWNDLSEE